ncbi:MAG: hypothetical protein ACE147_17100 [Candidatus Methylomirabilales bacterium]
MSLTHLGCPSCGGTMALAEGQRLVACRYCGREALALIPHAVSRYAVALGVDRSGASAALRAGLSGPALPPRIRAGALAIDWTLCYVPFYELTGTRVGTFLEREVVESLLPQTDGQETDLQVTAWTARREERTGTRVLEKDFLRIQAACDLPDLGLDRVALPDLRKQRGGVRLEPYDLVALQSRAVVFAPGRPPAPAAAAGPSTGGEGLRVIEEQVKILYYPIWHGRYAYGGRLYTGAVDGVTGAVLAARAPLHRGRAAWLFAAALAGGALAWSRVLHPILGSLRRGSPGVTLDGVLGGAVLVAVGLLAAGAAGALWRILRGGGELEWAGEAGLALSGAEASGGALAGLLGTVVTGAASGGRA